MKLGGDNPVSISRRSRPARSGSTSRLASAVCRKGRIIEIYGPESSGKTTLALHAWPRRRRRAASAPSSMPNMRSTRFTPQAGRGLDELLISQPDTGEQALEIADTLVRSGAVTLLVVDSVAALTPRPSSKATWATLPWPAGAPDEPGDAQADRLDLRSTAW
jgi:recombination protein RecA